MNKIAQTNKDLKDELAQQLASLVALCQVFDDGQTSIAKEIATKLRVLLYDRAPISKSLLAQLNLKDRDFISTSATRQTMQGSTWAGSFSGLIAINSENGFVPHLDNAPNGQKQLSFNEWWNEPIFIDETGGSFSRSNIVMTVVNQDGGAHVDPALDGPYRELSRNNSLGLLRGSSTGSWEPISEPHLFAIRQIAHEVLRSLNTDGYAPMQQPPKGFTFVPMGISISNQSDNTERIPRVGRNEPCPCGSGFKYKKCHDKSA